MRVVDSAISLAQSFNKKITVLWPTDNELNASFGDIFRSPNNKDIHIVDCPPGFPDIFLSARTFSILNPSRNENQTIREIKNHFHRTFSKSISRKHQEILDELNSLLKSRTFTNAELRNLYSAEDHKNTLSVNEMDELFLDKLDDRLRSFFESPDHTGYISTCYRLYKTNNPFQIFKPTIELQKKIDVATNNLGKYISVHIRKTDHQTSKEYSTTEKVIAALRIELLNSKNAIFFVSSDCNNTKDQIETFIGKERFHTNKVDNYRRDRAIAIKHAVVDLFCLSKGIKVLGSHHSTFSQAAAQIGNIPETTIK